MPNKCGVVNCKGNYNDANKCRVFKVPREELERKKWLDVLPPRENFVVDPSKFFICEKHWPSNPPMLKLPGGSTRPAIPPSIFNVPSSCLPTAKPPPRSTNLEDQQLKDFLKKDRITSFSEFAPDKELHKNCTSSRCVGLSFHKLPRAGVSKERDEWRSALNVISRSDKRFNPTQAKICSRHFEKRCFKKAIGGRRSLIPGSLPTLWMSPYPVGTPIPRNSPVPEWKEGCRIVDLWELAQQMNCKQCSALLDLNRTTWETRAGLASILYIVCQCGVTNKVCTSKKQITARMMSAYYINIQASISVQQHCRISAEQACKFLNGLGVPATEEVFDTTEQDSVMTSPSEAITLSEPLATCQETQSETEEVFDSTEQESVMPSPGENIPQLGTLTLCQETQSVFKIENREDFCEHLPQKAVDLLEPATTAVLFGGRAPAAWADMGTDGPQQHISTEMQVDNTESVEECQEVCRAALHNDTSIKEEDVDDTAGTLYQSQDLPLTKTAKGTEIPVHMCNPLKLEGTEKRVPSQFEDNSTVWNKPDKSAEAEHGESPSFDTPASVTDTQNHKDKGSRNLNSTSDSQKAAYATPKFFRLCAPKMSLKSLIVNDVCAPFRCSECGARFGLERALNRHKKVHAEGTNIVRKIDAQKNCAENQTEKISNRSEGKSCKIFNAHSPEKNDLSENSTDQHVEEIVGSQEGLGPSCEVGATWGNKSQEVLNGASVAETEKDKLAEKLNEHCEDCDGGEKSFKFSDCQVTFDTSSALEDHFKFHTDQSLFSCQVCSASFSKEKDLICHVSRNHGNKRTFLCPECSVTVTTASKLKNHMRIHTGEKPFKCEACEKVFTEMGSLKRHMQSHSGNLPHVCPDCGKAFAFASGLTKHRYVHAGQRPYTCQECRATFPAISNLNLHMRVHTDKRLFLCKICKKSYRQSGHLNRHIETHKEKAFLCQDCGKTFSCKEYLDHHYRIHTGEKPYKCSSCPATFSHFHSCSAHMRTHTGETFLCEVCQRAFKSKQNLKLHQEIHSGIECLCQYCGKTVLGKMRLQAHLRIHKRNIKGHYTCKDCGMTFTYLSNLYRHKKSVHLCLKPHQCKICQKSFSQSNALKVHLQIHRKSRS